MWGSLTNFKLLNNRNKACLAWWQGNTLSYSGQDALEPDLVGMQIPRVLKESFCYEEQALVL